MYTNSFWTIIPFDLFFSNGKVMHRWDLSLTPDQITCLLQFVYCVYFNPVFTPEFLSRRWFWHLVKCFFQKSLMHFLYSQAQICSNTWNKLVFWTWYFEYWWFLGCPSLPSTALQASELSKFKISSMSKHISVTFCKLNFKISSSEK